MAKIEVSFTEKGMKQLADYLRHYSESLQDKCERLVRELADIGYQIATAENQTKYYRHYVGFRTETPELIPYGCKAIFIGYNTEKIIAKWQTKNGVRVEEVSAILMSEFGSGQHAMILKEPEGLDVGRGTFPKQTHAFEDIWYYMDLNNEWHSSKGVKPSMPMWSASQAMQLMVDTKAKEIFSA